ncbi:MAG: S8 family serine peptidase, partial [Actinomycetia bacterium]|nr:S8 family serine peptidase [Actinomycetes bacterium]
SDALLGLATDDRHYSEQWALENTGSEGIAGADIDIEGARAVTDGEGVVVAVIDTGIDFSHPDLLPSRWVNEGETSCNNGLDDDGNGFVDDCHGWDFVDSDPTGYGLDAHWHGTHVAGIIAGTADNQTGIAGIAPGVRIMDLRVVDQFTTGAASVAAAIRYAVDNGAEVINLSLSTPPGEVPADDVPELAAALDHALAHDVVVVSAAGNDATNIDDHPVWPASFTHPNLVTVAASTWFDSGASFSNIGPNSVDLFAPGVEILSTSPEGGYRRADGTSMAAPHVAATAALVRAAEPALDASGVRDRLLATIDTGSGFTRASLTGGRLNAAQAVAGGPGPRVAFTFAGLDGATTGSDLVITITAAVDEGPGFDGYELGWAATLATRIDDTTYVLVDHEVGTAAGPGRTGSDGHIIVSAPAPAPSGPLDLGLTTRLPAGDYALIVETIVGSRPDLLIGTPRVELFTVVEDGAAPGPEDQPAAEPPDTAAEPGPAPPVDPTPPEPIPEPEAGPVTFPIENGEWRIDSMSPTVGSVGGGGHVTITGNFPDATFVWIGDTPVNVLAVSSQQLLAEIPRRHEPGRVDISLRTSAEGIVLDAPGVFTFLEENDADLDGAAPVSPVEGEGADPAPVPGGRVRPSYDLGEAETTGPLTLAPIAAGSLVWLERIWAD